MRNTVSEKTYFSIAEQFTTTPGGRNRATSGNLSGEVLRELHLAPLLRDEDSNGLLVDLDGTAGYASSFLDEAFAGLIRQEKFTADYLKQRLDFISNEDPTLVVEIWRYIHESK